MYLLLNLIITLLLLILYLSAVLLVLLAIFPVHIAAAFISEQQPDVHIVASWLSPLLKGYITRTEGHTVLTVYLLNSRAFSKVFTKKTSDTKHRLTQFNDYINRLRALHVRGIKLFASYSFVDPSVTGMIFGTIDIVSQIISFDEYYNNADFFSDTNYFNITAEARLNAAASILQLLRNKLFRSHEHAFSGANKK